MKYSKNNIQTIIFLTLIIMAFSLTSDKSITSLDLEIEEPSQSFIQTSNLKSRLNNKLKQSNSTVNTPTNNTSSSTANNTSSSSTPNNTSSSTANNTTSQNNTTANNTSSSSNSTQRSALYMNDARIVNNNYKPEDQKYFYIDNIVCNKQSCLPPNFCQTPKLCMCGEGRANYSPNEQTGLYCNYNQKKQIIAFMLETFISLGVGHFYCGRSLFGVFKLLLILGPLILAILMCCTTLIGTKDATSQSTSTCLGLFIMIASCTFICGGLVWQLVDMVMFGLNNYKDGNGVPLQHW